MADVSKRLEKAEKYLQKGKTEDALEEYLGILEQDPGSIPARQNAADLCLTLERNAEAGSLLGDLFDAYAAANDQIKALPTYKKLAKFGNPTTKQTLRFAALAERGSKHEAVEAYEKAIEALAAAGQEKDEIEALRRITALDPEEPTLKRLAELASKLQQPKLAAETYHILGKRAQQNDQESFPWFERAYQHDTGVAGVGFEYGRALLARGDIQRSVEILAPLALRDGADPAHREAYAHALIAAKRLDEAAPFIWERFEKGSATQEEVGEVISALIDAGKHHQALDFTRKLEQHETKAGRRREFIAMAQGFAQRTPPDMEYLEHMVEIFNSANRESDYCECLLKLFQLYYAANRFLKAADALDRAMEVDPYIEGHERRLELLRGKIDANRFNALSNRMQNVNPTEEQKDEVAQFESEPTVLEDLMLQAEIFLQYSMRSKAVERLERILKLFPREEQKNEKLRQLYFSAGMTIPPEEEEAAPAPPAVAEAPAAPKRPPTGPVPPIAQTAEESVDNFARVTEIARNIYRQANVKGVLFAAVNDVGRHWNVSRCVAGLCSPGKSPSAALEYCAPGVKQSDVMSIVKLLATLQQLAVNKGVVSIADAPNAPELSGVKQHIETLGIQSLLAVPLVEGDEHAGLLILEQCGSTREWRSTDVVVLKTIADQMTIAANNAKLRSLVKTLAVTDEKSGLLKRSSYLDVLISEVRRCMQQKSGCTVMLMHFGRSAALIKEIGEASVEAMMQQLGQTICAHIRQNDIAVRYQATIIALLLADTDQKNAFFVVDKFRKLLSHTRVPNTDRMVTMAAGIAEAVINPDYDSVDVVTEVINRAEGALDLAINSEPNSARALAAEVPTAAVA